MKKTRNILWGIVLIVVGLIIGGNSLGITNINIFFDGWWTLFIIIPCFIDLFKEKEKTGNVVGLLIGVALLLCCQDILNFDLLWKLAIPTILVIIGLSFIFKDIFNNKISKEMKQLNENRIEENEYNATFSGQDINFNNKEFEGADLNAVFGGIKCDLRKAIIEKDIIVNASSIFGGIDVLVPENVNVKIKSTSIFGGVDNKSENEENPDMKTIYINATCIFGGVEVK